jgi:Skp family chaperone for outer membrane proteins
MQIKSIAIAALAVSTAFATVSEARPARAQSQAQPQAAQGPLVATGPAIPGMCVLSNDYVIGASVVGKFVGARLGQLKSQVEAELNGAATALQTDGKALDAQRSTLTPEQFDQRGAALQVREREIQRTVQLRNAELQATQEKAIGRIVQEERPIIQQTITERNCSILISGQAAMAASSSMDVTPLVIQRLDAKLQQFQFDREHIDPSAAQGQ